MNTIGNLARLGVFKTHELLTGRHVLARLYELNRTQWLPYNELMALQRRKLQRVVEYAYQYVPYYKDLFDQVGFHPKDLYTDSNGLARIPFLTKDIIRKNFDRLLTTEPQRRKKMTRNTTSGSSGQPLTFMQDNNYRDYVTADIQRHLGWAGWQMGQCHAYIWGAKFEVSTQESFRTKLLDWTWNRFLTNAFLLSDTSLEAFTEQVRKRHPKLLFGYASSLQRFAQFVRQRGYTDVAFKGILSSTEVLLPSMRQFVEETFQCRIFDRYGARELGGIACECETHTGLHISVENNFIEILDDRGQPPHPGEVGNVIVTNLNNLGMPFIRYRNEDAAAWYTGDHCPCGRAAPMLKIIEGRVVEVFKTRDGRAVADQVWAGFAGAGYSPLAHPSIKQFQIVQKSLDVMAVRLVRADEIPQSVLDTLIQTIHTAFGEDVQVQFEFPDEIPPLPSGKHRYAISEVSSSGFER